MILYDIPYPKVDSAYGVTVRFTAGVPMTINSKEAVIEIEVESDEYAYAPTLTAEQARGLAAALVIAADMKERSEK